MVLGGGGEREEDRVGKGDGHPMVEQPEVHIDKA